MATWLIKSEPHKYPFSKLVADGVATWDGVRNYEARNNLRAMKVGDLALYYHSNEGLEVVGVARVKRAAYPDPTAPKSEAAKDWVAVDFEAAFALKEPVSLAAMKQRAKLKQMALVRRQRVSVVPVTATEFREVLAMGKTTKKKKKTAKG
jgi:predicted RNA-binding protein with PUA-like domain